MGIKFKSPLQLSAHRSIAHSDTAKTLIVKVITKTAAHPEHGNGSPNGYTIDGVEGAYLEFTPGNTYKFDLSDSSNNGHPLLFYEDAAKSTAYTTGVTNNHSSAAPGNAGSYTQIIPTATTPPILYYQCSSHSLMGSYVKFGTGTIGDTYSINVATDGSNVDLNLDAASGTDSTVQLTAGTNITLTRNDAQQVTIASTASGDTYDLNATQDGDNVDINLTSGSGSDNSVVQLTAGTGITLTRNSSAEVTVASSSSGTSGQVTTQLNVSGDGTTEATNGSRTAFTISSAPESENNLQVYIDGVYQSKSDFSVSGTTVTLDAAPATGAVLEIIHFTVIDAKIFLQSHTTSDSSTTSFAAGGIIANENDTQVYIDGVYQSKSNYSVSGSNVVLSTAPATGAVVEIVNIKASTTSGGSITWVSGIQTSNFTAAAGSGYFVNTTSGAITVSLPAGSAGEEIHFTDYASNFDTNELIFDANGSQKILGTTDNHKCTTKNATVRLIYQDDTKGWTADNIETTALIINFLVVAGGGGAGRNDTYYGGGGGGGGFRSSTDGRGGGQSSDTAITATSGTNYTVTVGGGGAEGSSGTSKGTTGSDSVFATITSKGGGGGGAYDSYGDGLDGGSGGGGGGNDDANTGGSALTSPVVHGYDGGDSAAGSGEAGGAGGGAGGVGASTTSTTGGQGGAAKAATITGSTVYYAAGGAGKAGWGGHNGNAGANATGNANSGDGGGGNDHAAGTNAVGRSGVVILKYASNITLTIGSGLTSSTATVGSNKVTTFTAGTGNVQFS